MLSRRYLIKNTVKSVKLGQVMAEVTITREGNRSNEVAAIFKATEVMVVKD